MSEGKVLKERGREDSHQERNGELGTVSESSKALLDPRRGEADISFPTSNKLHKDSLERNKTLSLNNILTPTTNRSRITIPIHSGMVSHSLSSDMSIVVPCQSSESLYSDHEEKYTDD